MPTAPQQIQPASLDVYLEVMSKAVFQSGMSWKVVEAKWSTTREAFYDFDATLQMIKKDFKFMGPTGIYFFLYVVGEQVPTHEEFETTYKK